jgi:hypothetical protein
MAFIWPEAVRQVRRKRNPMRYITVEQFIKGVEGWISGKNTVTAPGQ